jgi:hypothetical protein
MLFELLKFIFTFLLSSKRMRSRVSQPAIKAEITWIKKRCPKCFIRDKEDTFKRCESCHRRVCMMCINDEIDICSSCIQREEIWNIWLSPNHHPICV